jgi:RHS repeat-associated protein
MVLGGFHIQKRATRVARHNHMNGRIEDAVTGRFLSSDPYVPDPSSTQSFNPYSYASNNPVSRVDPSGFDDAPHVNCEDTCSVDSGGSGDGSGDQSGATSASTPAISPGQWDFLASEGSNNISCSGSCGFSYGIGHDSTSQGGSDTQLQVFYGSDQNTATFVGSYHSSTGWQFESADNPMYSGSDPGFGGFSGSIAPGLSGGSSNGGGTGGGGSAKSGSGSSVSSTTAQSQKPQQPCSGIAGGIQDFTGGASNQSFLDDVVNNFVDTKDTLANTVIESGASLIGGGTAANAYGGLTAGALAVQAWKDYQSPFNMTGIGFRTYSSAFATAGATWAINSVLIKGSYNAGVLAGSVLRTAINRTASATCTHP